MSQIKMRNKKTGEVRMFDTSQLAGSQPSSSAALTPEAKPNPLQSGRLLGGAIPIAGGIAGGMGGTAVGGPVGGAGGAMAGYGAGYSVEQTLEDLMKKQKENKLQQVKQGVAETGTTGLMELLSGPFASIASKAFSSLAKFVPTQLIKVALREPAKQAEKTAVAKAGQEVFEGATKRPAQELAEGIADRNMVGTSKQLLKKSVKQLSGLPGTAEAKLQTVLAKLPDKPNFSDIVMKAVQRIDEAAPATEATDEALDLAASLVKKWNQGKQTWQDLLKVRRNLDMIGKGETAEKVAGVGRAYKLAVADEMRNALRTAGGDEAANLFDELQFNMLLKNAAAKATTKPLFSRGDIIPLLIGGGIGASTGSLPLALGSVAMAKAPFMPGTATAGAYGAKKLLQLLSGASQVVPRVAAQKFGQNKIDELLNTYQQNLGGQ